MYIKAALIALIIYQQFQIENLKSRNNYLDELVIAIDKNSREHRKYSLNVNDRYYKQKAKLEKLQVKNAVLKNSKRPLYLKKYYTKYMKSRFRH